MGVENPQDQSIPLGEQQSQQLPQPGEQLQTNNPEVSDAQAGQVDDLEPTSQPDTQTGYSLPTTEGVDNTIRPEEAHTDRSTNIEKAHIMASEENFNRETMGEDAPDWWTNEAGIDYEIRKVAEKAGKSPEEVEILMQRDLNALFDFGHQIIQNQQEFSEKLQPWQQAFDLVYNYYKKLGNVKPGSGMVKFMLEKPVNPNDNPRADVEQYQTYVSNAAGLLDVDTREGGVFDRVAFRFAVRGESWDITPFGHTDEGAEYPKKSGAVEFGEAESRDNGIPKYREVQRDVKDDGFVEEIRRYRPMTNEDVEKLKSTLEEYQAPVV